MQVFLSMETVTEVSWSQKGHLKLVASGSRCGGSVHVDDQGGGRVGAHLLGAHGLATALLSFPLVRSVTAPTS